VLTSIQSLGWLCGPGGRAGACVPLRGSHACAQGGGRSLYLRIKSTSGYEWELWSSPRSEGLVTDLQLQSELVVMEVK
jgi:hypothetical protein